MLTQRIAKAIKDAKNRITAYVADRKISSQEIADFLIKHFETHIGTYPHRESFDVDVQIIHEETKDLFSSYKPFVDGIQPPQGIIPKIRQTYENVGKVSTQILEEGISMYAVMPFSEVSRISKLISKVSDEKLEETIELAKPKLKPLAYQYAEMPTYPIRVH